MAALLRRFAALATIALVSLAGTSPTFAQPVPTVAAASDLKFALEEVAASFQRDTGNKVQLVFGSSGNFYSQILQGAPFQMFMSADEDLATSRKSAARTWR